MKLIHYGSLALLLTLTVNLHADFRNYYDLYNRNLPQVSAQDTTNSSADLALRQRIRSALISIPEARGISIDVMNGNVSLRGSVRREEDRRRIEARINTLEGVVSIVNYIEIRRGNF